MEDMMLHQIDSIDVVGTGFTVLDRIYADGDFAIETLGGSCGNVLVSLAMLHRQVAPMISLGLDEVGERLVREFDLAGADTRYIFRREDRRSPILRQELDSRSGRHSFSFSCRETQEEFPRFESIDLDEVEFSAHALSRCTVFYADRLSASILHAMSRARAAGAIVYFEPSDADHALFDEALALTTILKYSSDRLGPELDERICASRVLAIATHGADGLEIRHGCERAWSAAIPASRVTDTCGSGDMVSVGIIEWILARTTSRQNAWSIDDLMEGVVAGQRLAAANCEFTGARGVFRHHNAAYVRKVLDLSQG
jgi:fructokinase